MTATRTSAAQRLRDLVSAEAWGPAEVLARRLDTERMIVIDRARAAATPRHAADRDAATTALVRDLRLAYHEVDADDEALFRAAIVSRDHAALPELLAAMRVPYGRPIAPSRRECPLAEGSSTTAAHELSGQSAGSIAEVVVALADPRPPESPAVAGARGPQTTAHQHDGFLLELPRSFESPELLLRLRRLCEAGQLTCPVPGCPDRRLVLRAGTSTRPHFAHRPNTGIRHDPSQAWILRAIAALQASKTISEARPDTQLRWVTETGPVRIIGPRSRPVVDPDAHLVAIATRHLTYIARAKTARGEWLDLVAAPAVLTAPGQQLMAIDHACNRLWCVTQEPITAAPHLVLPGSDGALHLARRI